MKRRRVKVYGGTGVLVSLPLGLRWVDVEEGHKFVHIYYLNHHYKVKKDKWPGVKIFEEVE